MALETGVTKLKSLLLTKIALSEGPLLEVLGSIC
jgi:hypothetical protein